MDPQRDEVAQRAYTEQTSHKLDCERKRKQQPKWTIMSGKIFLLFYFCFYGENRVSVNVNEKGQILCVREG